MKYTHKMMWLSCCCILGAAVNRLFVGEFLPLIYFQTRRSTIVEKDVNRKRWRRQCGMKKRGQELKASSYTQAEVMRAESIYVSSRYDRSGSAILPLLRAHAHCYVHNCTLMGACWMHDADNRMEGRLLEHRRLIEALGLSDLIQFRCPHDKCLVVDGRKFGKWSDLQNADWLRYIRSYVAKHAPALPPKDVGVHKTVVHIRRGDVNPCMGNRTRYQRYLPNSYYMDAIQKYVPSNSSVVIFSEAKSVESFDDFHEFNVSLRTSKASIWSAIATADLVILSKSMFSYVPALLNHKSTVIYAPFFVPAARVRISKNISRLDENWLTVEPAIENEANQVRLALRAKNECTGRRQSLPVPQQEDRSTQFQGRSDAIRV